ncbi:MAG: nodulation protein nolNO [Methylococcaceae bacterium]|nr:nodulation protein nolNO [Methylococcaceae bacterium]
MKTTYFIGLSVTYHDPAIAIVDCSRNILFAEATERHLQLKRALNCEPDSLYRIVELLQDYCPAAQRFHIGFNWLRSRPFYEHFCSAADYFTPQGLLRPRFAKRSTFFEKYKIFHMLACQTHAISRAGINIARMVREAFPSVELNFRHFDHHLTHAAFACYASPFAEADCVVVDSYGEHGSLAFYRYREGRLSLYRQAEGIESLGFFYMKLTELCGFNWIKGEEWKVMGLAAYGSFDDGVYKLFRSMVQVDDLGLKQRLPEMRRGMELLERQFRGCRPMEAADLAYTGQYFFAELMLGLLENFRSLGFSENLVLCGGCALNSSFNGQIAERSGYCRLYIPPAPADDGTAVGAAVLACDRVFGDLRKSNPEPMSPYLGSTASAECLQRLVRFGAGFKIKHLRGDLARETAKLLSEGRLIGWMQGRAEFGPRALGNRSILADPRRAEMKHKINSMVKFREEFRPFAPAILHEFGEQYFENYVETPYMERALRFRAEACDRVPAVVHVDHTGRLQTVKREWNAPFHDLLQAFHRITDVPVLLNTSFNVMGKPIIHTVEDALGVFLTTGLDALVIGDYLLSKPTEP